MRLWSLHPSLLDRQALIASWREGLLAQSVLTKTSGGYSNHPQLARFRASGDASGAMATFLQGLVHEADARGYRFDRTKIVGVPSEELIPVTLEQLRFEAAWLCEKLRDRSPEWPALAALSDVAAEAVTPHPLFRAVPGPIEPWERGVLSEAPKQ
ncbi:pyrimidine dimer DNA glycosylase/endonuclease V [Humidisolicoccus flavus]|uniref:pyrimidine dimer DNA glycosylase/endonuclease V n=1 Tax=Humidisolicoccus flavus TaxID=3111414 RepID=UPI00324EFB5F